MLGEIEAVKPLFGAIYELKPGYPLKCIKTESTRELSNFNFQRTKTLYQNNLKHIAFFFTCSRAKDAISHLS